MVALRELLAVAAEKAPRLAVFLLPIALDRRQVQRLVRERTRPERDAEQHLDALAALGRILRRVQQHAILEVRVVRIPSLRIELHALRQQLGVRRLRTQVIERRGPRREIHAVAVELGEHLATLLGGRAHRIEESRLRGVARIGMLREHLAIVLARVIVPTRRPIALREAKPDLVRLDALLPDQRPVFGRSIFVLALREQPVRHRQPVRRQDRNRKNRNKKWCNHS